MPSSLLELRWLKSWPVVVLLVFGFLGTVGTTAVVSLFRIPTAPNCRAVFWPTASASLRLQCAESFAAEGTVKNLLAAIALVDHLPEDHPLRFDINQRIETWADQILDLAERSFEAGDLAGAISAARKIPAKTTAASAVEERITRWQSIWQEGENIFNTAVAQLKKKDFQKAFSLSVELLDVPNKYWAGEKYNELTKMISLAREDTRKLSEALGFAKQGTLKGFTEALKRLKDIGEDSVFYAEAQSERKNIAKQMLKAAEDLLADKALSKAQDMLDAIPRDTGLSREIADFQIFVSAYQQAWAGNVSGLESAINRMKTLGKDRPRYAQGQKLIAQWESELRNLSLLTQAQERAGRGSTADLTAAIEIARQIPRSSPQGDEASRQINQWQTRVETVEDRPILERADRLAGVGTADNLRAAIQEARKIGSGRTLRAEADERVATWTSRIQRIEDQPILDQARARAQSGDLPGAIAIAARIGQGRALYSAAQADIDNWQAQEDGRSRLSEAVTAAASGDANALARAIEIAQRVPAQSSSKAQADSQIERWSWELLTQAETVANNDLDQAITIAGRIPSQAEAYASAQIRIENWQAERRQLEESQRPLTLIAPADDANADELPNRR
ncbi:MAG: chromosome segregation ATPase [Phormidesmis sp. RL_2_1]|nr:chromosome segregation ATPase [Phormidesmis sp. RL_2_1]